MNSLSRASRVNVAIVLALAAGVASDVDASPRHAAQPATPLSLTCERANSDAFVYDTPGGRGTWKSTLLGSAADENVSLTAGPRNGATLRAAGAELALTARGRRCRAAGTGRVDYRRANFARFVADLGPGADTIQLNASSRSRPLYTRVLLGPGNDTGTLMGPRNPVTRALLPFTAVIHGGPGDDRLVVDSQSPLADTEDDYQLDVVGGTGNDNILGSGGAEHVTAGPGNDLLETVDGPDIVELDGGQAQPAPGADDDVLDAGEGDDSVVGGAGTDAIALGDGDDTFTLTRFGQGVVANALNTTVNCGPGNDLVITNGGTIGDTIDCENVLPVAPSAFSRESLNRGR